MSRLLLDTNILIYLLAGNRQVRDLVSGQEWHISFISEMELQMKPDLSKTELQGISALLDECSIIDFNHRIKEGAINLARNHRLRLADSIIFATALQMDMPLLMADSEFAKADPDGKDVIIFTP